MDMKQKIEQITERRQLLQQGGGTKEIEKQHGVGKLTAWERMGLLFDEGVSEGGWCCATKAQ